MKLAQKKQFISSSVLLFCKISFVLNICIVNLYSAESPRFSSMMIHISQMMLDEGVTINEVINNERYIILKGVAPNQQLAFLLAEKLFHSNMQKDFKFKDIIPFWEKDKFTFFLKKSKAKDSKPMFEITDPIPRAVISGNFVLKGRCSKDKVELNLTGSITGKMTCRNGLWSVKQSVSQFKTNIIGLKVSEGLAGGTSEDYRSFLIKRP
jgi:hypothetical protein